MQPLSQIRRRISLVVLLVIFFVGTPVLIAYTTGYRIDSALGLVYTGGIYVQSDIANINVSIDGKFVREGGLLLRNTYVQNLRPHRPHRIVAEKDGYTTWAKTVYVYPKLVTEARVFMLPRERVWNPVPRFIDTQTIVVPSIATTTSTTTAITPSQNPIHAFYEDLFASDRDQFAVDVATTTLVAQRGTISASTTIVRVIQIPEWLRTVASSSPLLSGQSIRERNAIALWLEDGTLFATWVSPYTPPPHFFCMAVCKSIITMRWQEPILRYDFYPGRNDVVVVLTEKGVFAAELDDRSDRTIIPLYEGAGLDFRVTQGSVIVVRDGDTFFELR